MAKSKIYNTFQRYEKKYKLTKEQFAQWSKILDQKFQLDEYGVQTISSTYYDTSDFQVIQRSLDKPSFREKLRLRSYGATQEEDIVFLELKKKVAGISYKRRAPLSLKEAEDYMETLVLPRATSQILKEIDWYISRHPLEPIVVISYERGAFFQKDDVDLRLTMDQNIRWRDENLSLTQGGDGTPLLEEEYYIMEIKAPESLPEWLCRELSLLEIYPVSFSKSGMVYTTCLLPQRKQIVTPSTGNLSSRPFIQKTA